MTLSALVLVILVSTFLDKYLCACAATFFLAAASRIAGKMKYSKTIL